MIKEIFTFPFTCAVVWLLFSLFFIGGTEPVAYWSAIVLSQVWFGLDYIDSRGEHR